MIYQGSLTVNGHVVWFEAERKGKSLAIQPYKTLASEDERLAVFEAFNKIAADLFNATVTAKQRTLVGEETEGQGTNDEQPQEPVVSG